LTQGGLAGGRFTKEYLSQIECGRTKPTADTVAWLADQLGVDPLYLESGVSSVEYAESRDAIDEAERAIRAKDYDSAVAALVELRPLPDAPDLHVRRLLAESWARMYLGELRTAVACLEEARGLAEQEPFTDADRAEVLYRLGCCRYKLSSIGPALGLFTEALTLAERSDASCDRLRAHIFEWRSRCYRRQRDWEAAREDIERALELAESLEDAETVAHVEFQASIVAERTGSWVRARTHAERARAIYEGFDDQVNVARLLNNLGGLTFLLGDSAGAVAKLEQAFRVALEAGSEPDAAQAVSSLAQVVLRNGDPVTAERHARQALSLLVGRVDYLYEIGNAQLVLGRSLMEQGKLDDAESLFAAAEASLGQLSSASHSAAAWMAQGDLELRRGDDRAASVLYRRAAEALQEVHF
ncbi:MAG: tetratricopeptide repeat protein, partial [Actinomycetota bacterium]|nr:tetratricopeptide repeat protein [Actinomycetota bacterium]